MDWNRRRSEVLSYRKGELYRLQKTNTKGYYQSKKNFRKTEDYIHLTFDERKTVIREFSEIIGGWGFARLFAECIDKIHFNPAIGLQTVDEQAFEQIVSRFEHYLQIISRNEPNPIMGMLIHDNNETVAKRLTELMMKFHQKGTLWTNVTNIIETPLFVDSQLTCMVQAADVCSYALRRYFENGEEELFDSIYVRADRVKIGNDDEKVVGVRHFTKRGCTCKICQSR